MMMIKMMKLAVLLVVVVAEAAKIPADVPTTTLEEAFGDRAVVEAVVECFIDNTICTAEQEKIRERAMATMRNMGRCPKTLCTDQEQKEMTRAMELLQQKHRDLWIKLLVAMFDLQLPP